MADKGVAKIHWTVAEIVSTAMDTFGRNWKALMLAQLLLLACVYVPLLAWGGAVGGIAAIGHSALEAHTTAFTTGAIVTGVITLIGSVVLLLMIGPAALRMVVAAARGQKPEVRDLFSRPFQRAGTMIAASLLFGLAVMGGMIAFVIPAILAMLGLCMTYNFIIEDDSIGAVDSLSASWKMMRGHKLHWWWLSFLVGGSTLVGMVLFSIKGWMWPLSFAFSLFSTSFGWLVSATLYARLRPLPTPAALVQPVLAATA
jgi:uncharacterized membrane protein